MATVLTADAVALPRPAPARERLRHVPALDGLRGFALCAVLLYHGGYAWIPGGFLSVSTFFTLSGFLITGLILDGYEREGRLDARSFWLRRARRLMPAALVTLLVVLVMQHQFGAIAPSRLRGDLLAALTYIENWWLIHTSQSYGAIFGVASPVQHFWSLAIEEQYYVVFPLLLAGLFRWLRRPARVAGVIAVLAAGSLTIAAFLQGTNPTRAYFGTDARAFDILAGVLLAFAWARRRRNRSSRIDPRVELVGVVGLAALVLLWLNLSLHSHWLFRGADALNGLCTVAIIVACLQAGVVGRFMAIAPLRFLGTISYGVYLLHWPFFLWLTPQRLGLGLTPTFVVRLAVTIAAAVAMYRLIEEPIRRGRLLTTRGFIVAVAVTVTAIVLWTLSIPGAGPAAAVDLADPSALNNQVAELRAAPAAAGRTRVLVAGDSLAWTVSTGLDGWGRAHHMQVGHYLALGCGIGGPGTLRYLGIVQPTFAGCASWHDSMGAAVRAFRPDVVLVVIGLADTSPRRFPDGRFHSIGAPAVDAMLRAHVAAMTHKLGSTGARVVWARVPHMHIQYVSGVTGQPPFAENDHRRMDRLNAIVAASVHRMPRTGMVDIAGYGQRRPGGEFDPDYRPDGVHLTVQSSLELARWLGPRLHT